MRGGTEGQRTRMKLSGAELLCSAEMSGHSPLRCHPLLLLETWPVVFSYSRYPCSRERLWRPYLEYKEQDQFQLQILPPTWAISDHSWIIESLPPVSDCIENWSLTKQMKASFPSACYKSDGVTVLWRAKEWAAPKKERIFLILQCCSVTGMENGPRGRSVRWMSRLHS